MGHMDAINRGHQELLDEISSLKQHIQELELYKAEHQHMDDSLREIEAKYRFIMGNTADIIRILDLNQRCVYLSPSVFRIRGFTVEEASERTIDQDLTPESLQQVLSAFEEEMTLEATGTADPDRTRTLELETFRKDGSLIWMEANFSFIRDTQGKLTGILVISRDISERKKAERALRKSEQALRTILDNTYDAIFIHDLEGRILEGNQRMLDLYEITKEQAIRSTIIDDFSCEGSSLAEQKERWDRVMKGETVTFEWKAKRPNDGSLFDVDIALNRIDLGSRPVVLANVRDITRRKATETALRESEEKFRAVVENSRDTIMRFDRRHRLLYVNPNVKERTGISPENFIGKTLEEAGAPEELCSMMEQAAEQAFLSGEIGRTEFQLPDGTWLDSMLIPERDASGKVKAVISSSHDITAHKQNEALWRVLFQAAPLAIGVIDEDRILTRVNDHCVQTFGYRPEEMVGRRTDFLYFSGDEYRAVGEALYSSSYYATKEVRMKRKDGGSIWVLLSRSYLNGRDASEGSMVIVQDITTRKALEEQLRQAQKMEAIGQLAGGVAHDFNNILQAILGYTNMVLFSMGHNDRNYGKLKEVEKAGERAAALTRQLLAFSRRQVLQLGPLDLNQVVDHLMKMLRRLIGENIELSIHPGHALWKVNADRSQIEQVLINLCVNARDAMPDGGRLSIETQNVWLDEDYCIHHDWAKPGRYVLLSITDSGCGMDGETQKKIFEPFFTTKEKSHGTGLGLATVYGVVRQHDGMIQVYSETGKGSRFNVYLPVTESTDEEILEERQVPSPGGHETILMAEDDEPLRFLTTEMLKMAGYRVLAAVDGEDALRIYQEHGREVDLLLLDVVMPRKGGRTVYDEIRAINPEIRCLFMSGYSEDAVHTNFILDHGLKLIQKPFKSLDLMRMLRQELDRS
ncbi:MAG: Blue-light-activated protein [Syntrophus sp. PtaB.Bin138]|nr:MAG: Blue-light-activated protein [Syntrophus sp. PtaB.Bin138]